MALVVPTSVPVVAEDAVPRKLPNRENTDDYYKPFPPNQFGPKQGHEKLNIGIVGAGIAGLTAAVALLESGHSVEIYEKSKFKQELGAAIMMCPNASRILSHYGFDFGAGCATLLSKGTLLDANTMRTLREFDLPDCEQLYGAPWYLFHRVDLHDQLRILATEPRPSTAGVAKIRLSSEVVDVGTNGIITFANGEVVHKDLVVVSDGVRNKIASKVNPHSSVAPAAPTGTAVYRFLISREKLLEDAQLRHMFEGDKFSVTIARTEDTRLVWYPCRQRALQNFGLFVPDEFEDNEENIWNISASFDEFMQSCSVLHKDLQAICQKAEQLKVFRLFMRESPLNTLTRGKIVLIGDASHPMLPHQGQGGATAVEDGAALGVLFSNFTSKDDIPRRLQLFEKLRLDRVSAIQILSSVGQDEIYKVLDKAQPYIKGSVPATFEALNAFNFGPNVMRDALGLLNQA